tara:strand:- start:257 stop:694 length:438 start_codon:yes stop_codon:yes gene_type:complete
MKQLEKLREIELFEGKSLDDIFKVIYEQSIDQQNEAMNTFKKMNAFVEDAEDAFMSGDKAAPYLDSAHKATENIIKMVTASQKMVTQEEETPVAMSQSDILSVLDNEGIAPKRFLPDDEEENNIEEETQKDFSANFTALKKQSQQ